MGSMLLLGAGRAGGSSAPLWGPDQLSNLTIWLKGDEISGSQGDNIASWSDASGNANHATQSTEADKPNLEVAEQNGLNAVKFDNANSEYMNLPNVLTALTAGTIAFVVKMDSQPAPSSAGIMKIGSSGNNDHYNNVDTNIYSDFASTVRKNAGAPAAGQLNQWHIAIFRSASADWKYFRNGTQQFTTGTNTVGWSTAPKIGTGLSTGATTAGGIIGEIVLLGQALSVDDRQKLEGYLAHKWALTAGLDAGHPYKSSPPTL